LIALSHKVKDGLKELVPDWLASGSTRSGSTRSRRPLMTRCVRRPAPVSDTPSLGLSDSTENQNMTRRARTHAD